MLAFDVQDMSCGHCVRAITQAIQAADANAAVRIDLERHRVEIDATAQTAEQLGDAIRKAGYTPVPL